MATIKRCKAPFAFDVDGRPRVVAAGAIISTDDPAYRKEWDDMFEDVDVHVAHTTKLRERAEGKAPVEQATAAPGEKREAVRPTVARQVPATKKD